MRRDVENRPTIVIQKLPVGSIYVRPVAHGKYSPKKDRSPNDKTCRCTRFTFVYEDYQNVKSQAHQARATHKIQKAYFLSHNLPRRRV